MFLLTARSRSAVESVTLWVITAIFPFGGMRGKRLAFRLIPGFI